MTTSLVAGDISLRQKRKEAITEQEVRDYKMTGCPSCGACAFLGTASTMQCVAEALGMALPGTAVIPATMRDILSYARLAGRKIMELVEKGITPSKILTKEASVNALVLALLNQVNDIPVVFAKKGTSKTVNDDLYTSEVYSYTKGTRYIACVKKKYLNENENVILVDDFLADGNAMLGLVDMCNQAKAHIDGCGIIIEKGFQKGHEKLVDLGYKVESLAIIESFENGKIVFK